MVTWEVDTQEMVTWEVDTQEIVTWEVATQEIVTWEVALGKMPFGKYLTHSKQQIANNNLLFTVALFIILYRETSKHWVSQKEA